MSGLGTLINALAIIAGGIVGICCKKLIKERYQETIMKATGFSVMFLGAGGTFSKMLVTTKSGLPLDTTGSMSIVLSMVIGAFAGEIIDLDHQFERFGSWLKHKTGSDGDNQFINGFVTASLTVSIGAMGIMGAIQDGIYGDHTTPGGEGHTGLCHCVDYGFFHGQGLYLFLYSGGSLAGTDYRPGRGAVRVYDRSGAEQPVHGGKYPDFLRGRESGLAEDH